MKGSHVAKHKNGWLDPSITTADYTTGIFTDTLLVSAPNYYPYISSYRSETEKVVVVIHDTISSSFVPVIGKAYGKAFPNPIQNALTISSPVSDGKIEITDMLGKSVFIQQFHCSDLQLDLSDLRQGMYILKINDAVIQKIVKN